MLGGAGSMKGEKLMIYKNEVQESFAGLIPALLPFGTIMLTPVFGSL